MLQERDQRRGHGDDLLGADVHVLDLVGPRLRERVAVAGRDALVDEVALVVEARVGLGDVVLLLLVRGEIDDLVGDTRLDRECGRLLLLELGNRLLGELRALLQDNRAALGGNVGIGDLVGDVRRRRSDTVRLTLR